MVTPKVITHPHGDRTFTSTLYYGADVRESLKNLPDQSVQCAVTSPPYWGLRSYLPEGSDLKSQEVGLETTPDEYVAAMVEVFREVRRVLRDDGVLWLNIGDSYTSGGRDSRAPDSKDSKGGRENDTRLPTPSGLKPKDLVGIPWRVAFALQADGWYLRSDIIWSKSNPMPESVTDRPTRSHEYVFLLTKRARYFYDAEAVRETVTGTTNTPTKSVANSRPERGLPSAQQPSKHHCGGATDGYRNARSVWTITPEPYSGAHFATMPPGLARRCILAGSRKGDVVLDPFSGSGTTGYVANRLGRHYIGTDLNPDYLPLSEARLTGMDPPETDESTSDEGPLSVLDLL